MKPNEDVVATDEAEFDYVIFGATGDLTMRKLMPALYHQRRAGAVARSSKIVGTARSSLTSLEYRDRIRTALERFVNHTDLNPADIDAFVSSVHYVSPWSTSLGSVRVSPSRPSRLWLR